MPEARLLKQLVEALLYERIATWASELYPALRGAERDIHFQLGSANYRCRGRVGAFGRVRVTRDSVKRIARYTPRETHWREVLADVPGDAKVKAAIAEELANTERLCRWNAQHLPLLARSRRGLPYRELERLLHEGHPYHPCFKSRTGFSLEDHAAYGPEAGRAFELRWVAVARPHLALALPRTEDEHFRAELGAEAFDLVRRALSEAGADPARYGLLPVHPWQWRKLGESSAVRAALGGREIVDLGISAGKYRASQSLRTLLPLADGASHLKVPLAVRVTSSLRTLPTETVKAAPALSTWLQSLVVRDAFFDEVAGAVVLAEHAGIAYEPGTAATAELGSNLSAIWREPIDMYLRGSESAIPFNALFATEPDGLPYVDDWIRQHGLANWLKQLLRVTLLPLWRLLCHHGIALEAHAQNLVLLHDGGWPTRLALRDFHDSLEYAPSFLAEPDLVPRWASLDRRFAEAEAGRHYAMAAVVELRDLFIDTVLVFNLSELSWRLEESYGFTELEFWRLVRGVLRDYSRSAWCDPEREAVVQLRAPFVHVESLFKARLRAPADALFRHLVPSALFEHAEEEMHAGHQ